MISVQTAGVAVDAAQFKTWGLAAQYEPADSSPPFNVTAIIRTPDVSFKVSQAGRAGVVAPKRICKLLVSEVAAVVKGDVIQMTLSGERLCVTKAKKNNTGRVWNVDFQLLSV